MIRRYVPPIPSGVLLSRHSEVHRDVGGRTACGDRVPAGRVAPVTRLQAIVYKLGICNFCYPHAKGGES